MPASVVGGPPVLLVLVDMLAHVDAAALVDTLVLVDALVLADVLVLVEVWLVDVWPVEDEAPPFEEPAVPVPLLLVQAGARRAPRRRNEARRILLA